MDDKLVRAVIFRDGGAWVAQCLEHDIGAQAPDLDALQFRFSVALNAELHESMERNGAPFAGIDPAPQEFHEMWERSAGTFKPANPSSIRTNGSAVQVDMKLAA